MRRNKATSDELVTIARFSDPFAAQLAHNDLQAAGIKSFLIDQAFTSNVWYLTTAVGGIRLQVAAGYAERAAKILSRESHAHRHEPEADVAEDDFRGDDATADEDQDDEPSRLTPREDDARRAFRCSILSLLLPFLGIYTVWLLLKVWISHEELSRAMRNRALWAAALSLPVVIELFLLFKWW